MKEGYKKTEIGVIPVEWEVVKLKDIGQAIIGLTYSPKDVVDSVNDAHLVLRSSNVQKSKILLENNVYVNKKIQEKLIVKEGDILICSRNGSKHLIGKNAYISKKYEGHTFGAFMTIYRSKYSKFVYQLLQTDLYKKQINSNMGATINQITTGNLNSFRFPFPPLKEQKEIANILSTSDEKIEAIDLQIQKAETLKKGLLQKLLSEGIGHSEFKDSELGRIPVGWEVSSLNICVSEMRGGAPFSPSDFTERGHLVLHKGNVVHGGKLIQKHAKYTSYQYADKHSSNTVDNSFLITTLRDLVPSGPTIGLIVRITDENKYVLAQGAYGFQVHNQLNAEFIIQYSNTRVYRKLMQSIAVGSTQIHIRSSEFLSINIPLPPLKEQKQIAQILSTSDEKLEVLRAKKEKYETLKKGLLQKLLSGEVRV